MISFRIAAPFKTITALFVVLLLGGPVRAQGLRVLPVNIQMTPGQRATTMTVVNEGSATTAIQIRAYAWNQPHGTDQLDASDEVVASPPLVSIAPGAKQLIRLVLRHSPQGREATYRILLDQIPVAGEPGVVQIVLRMSIPIFAQSEVRGLPHLLFHIESDAGQSYLVGVNDGLRHEVIRDIMLLASDGRKLRTESSASPYILAGATRRWPIALQGSMPLKGETLQLTAHADTIPIEQQVPVVGIP
jgi:fimbrial chaperone protein